MISPTVMLMTLNEELNVEAAIRSFPPETRIIVYDSFSSDATVELAKSLGASVVQRKFDNWAAHQNWGAQNIDFGSEWVYYTDADERMTPELWNEILVTINSDTRHVAFSCRRKDLFLGTWIKRSSFYPHWFVRLYKPRFVRWERLVNPTTHVSGTTGRLAGHFLHYPFSKGVGQWFERHIGYARYEAQELLNSQRRAVELKALVSSDTFARRAALKALFYRLPARPLLKFLVLYFVRRGFLDGRAGFYYAAMQAVYEFMISLEVLEQTQANHKVAR